MCHYHSSAPPPPGDVVAHQDRTRDELAVPFEVFQHADHDGSGNGGSWLVLATDIYGITGFYRHVAGLLAADGYRVAMPDLFHRLGAARDGSREAAFERRARLDDARALHDLNAVVDAVRAPDPSAEPYGMLGFCIGGTLALLAAAGRPEQQTVVYYGFPYVVPGGPTESARPVDTAHKIEGPVLGFWGRDDQSVAPSEVEDLRQALAGGSSEHDLVCFDHAGHAFLAGLTEDRPDSDVARESWQRTREFFTRKLSSRAAVR